MTVGKRKMSDSNDDMEAYTGSIDEDDSYGELEGRITEAVEYCLPFVHYMWAARTISILLNCDFRDAKEVAESYLEEFND